MNYGKYEKLGRLALIATTLIWGTSFVILKSTLDNITPLWILTLRFSGAAVVVFLAVLPRLKKIDRQYLKGGILMGTFLATAYTVQTYGLVFTTPGKNAFLTATYCILAPFLYWGIYKRKPDKYNISAAIICSSSDKESNSSPLILLTTSIPSLLQIETATLLSSPVSTLVST